MTFRVESWHVRYRLPGRSGLPVPPRLEAARNAALDECAAVVARELGSDPTVYVVREVHSRWAVNVAAFDADRELARHWGERLARSIARAVASPDVARFPDTAAFLAEFLLAARRGVAASDWRFAPLGEFLHPDLGQTAAAILTHYRDHLAAVLRHLHQLGGATEVLAALPREKAFELWCDKFRGGPPSDPDTERPLFAVAVRIATDLHWLSEPRATAR